MRPFSFTIDSSKLSRGLRPSKRLPRNNGFLVKCNGAVGKNGVLKALPDLEALDLSFITDGFPYPQLFVFPYVTIACGASKIYEKVGGNFTEKLDITGYENSPWAIEASGNFLYLSNGRVVFIRDPFTKEYIVADKLPTFQGVTNYNGQIVIAAPVFPIAEQEEQEEGHTNLPWADEPSWGSGSTNPIYGPIWATGNNAYGQLGLGDTTQRHVWTLSGADDWLRIGGGVYWTSLIKKDGTLWTVGYNQWGELGLGDTTERDTLTQVGTDKDWIWVGGTGYHSFAVKSDGSLWGAGRNSYGQLGTGDEVERDTFTHIGTDTWEQAGSGGGASYGYAIRGDGRFCATYATGGGGIGTAYPFAPLDQPTDKWKKMVCGTYHVLIIKDDNTLWGSGIDESGHGALAGYNIGYSMAEIADGEWLDIAAGWDFSLAIKADGSLWGTGLNNEGQLGLGDTTDRHTWTLISSDKWKSVTAGQDTTLAIKDDDTLWGCGFNAYGELGIGDTTERDTLTKIGSKKWLKVICAFNHSIAIEKTW